MSTAPPRCDDLSDVFIGVGLRHDRYAVLTRYRGEDLIPADVARVDRPIDRVVIAGAMLLKRCGCGLEVLHLPLACHPLGMCLGSLFERLVVGQRGEVVLLPLPIDSIEHIADERGVLGDGGEGQHGQPKAQDGDGRTRRDDHSIDSVALRSMIRPRTTRSPRNPPR